MANVFDPLLAALRAVESMKNRVQTVAMKQLEADMKERIFQRGQAADGSRIGNYSTKPLYAVQDNFSVRSKFKPRGKNNPAPYFHNKKPRRSMYFPDGYKELREAQGFETETVNLDYTGSLRRSIIVGTFGSNVVLGFSDAERFEIAEGNEDRFNKEIFTPSDAEERAVDNIILRELDRIIFNELGI